MARSQPTRAGAAPARTRSKSSDFAHLLQKEFKPQDRDRRKEAVETAVRTLAEQALVDSDLISDDVVDDDRGASSPRSTRS